MLTVRLVCLLLAFIFELLAAVGIPSNRINLMALGLVFYFLALLLPDLGALPTLHLR